MLLDFKVENTRMTVCENPSNPFFTVIRSQASIIIADKGERYKIVVR
jgi:hypothetical protein